jgi:tetratricopeptide (TPR) repeat protein
MLDGTGEDMTTRRSWLVLTIVAAMVIGPGCESFKERVLLKKGNELYAAQKYEEAIKQYDELVKLNPKSWDGNYLMAVSYLALYHPGSEHPKDKEYAEKGLAAFESTLELPAPSPDDREKTEKFYLSFLNSTGDKDKAIAYLEKQLGTRPNDLTLINQIATLYQKAGNFTKALEYFEKRANMDPTNKETWYTLGVNCWARSYHGGLAVSQEEREQVVDKGIEALNKALAIDPNYFDALSYINLIYREKAKALASVGKNAEAGQAYAKADEYQKQAIDIRKAQTAKAKSGG